MCLDRKHLSDSTLIERIKAAHDIADDRLIIQADGIPMSGGTDDYNTTLQAVAIADTINKALKYKVPSFRKLPVLISGGTNSFTGDLARQFGVNFNGITIGTHARKVISAFEAIPSEMSDKTISQAVNNAKLLISKNLLGV